MPKKYRKSRRYRRKRSKRVSKQPNLSVNRVSNRTMMPDRFRTKGTFRQCLKITSSELNSKAFGTVTMCGNRIWEPSFIGTGTDYAYTYLNGFSQYDNILNMEDILGTNRVYTVYRVYASKMRVKFMTQNNIPIMSCIAPFDGEDTTVTTFKAFCESPNSTPIISFGANAITRQTSLSKYLTTAKVYGSTHSAVQNDSNFTGNYNGGVSTPPNIAWKWILALCPAGTTTSDLSINIEVDYYFELLARQAGTFEEPPVPSTTVLPEF